MGQDVEGSSTILHYDGTAWRVMTSGSDAGVELSGVWGSSGSDVFAVGRDYTILHYNGATWSAMTSGSYDYLTGVWGSSGSDVFAVGTSSSGDHRGIVAHYRP